MPIFPCPACKRNLQAGDNLIGQSLNCPNPVCGQPVTVPHPIPAPTLPDTRILRDPELIQLEAIVSEWERKIQTGENNIATAMRIQLENIATPEETARRVQINDEDWLKWRSGEVIKITEGGIDPKRLATLKNSSPNDSHVSNVVSRATRCYLTLQKIFLTLNEENFPPDLRAAERAENQELLRIMESMYGSLLNTNERR